MARDERARKIERTILQTLASVGQTRVADSMGVSESKVTRLKKEQIPEFCEFLAALDLKVVPKSERVYREESIAAIIQLAKERMAQLNSPEALAMEDEWG